MPISRDDFERGRTPDSLEDRVTQVLDGQPGQAFELEELAGLVGYPLPPLPPDDVVGGTAEERMGRSLARLERWTKLQSFQISLDLLVRDGKIRSRIVATGAGDKWHYSAKY